MICPMTFSLPLLALLLALGAPIRPSTYEVPAHEGTVRRFLQLRERMLGERSTPADVDALLALFTPAAVYEHPVAHVRMTLPEARSGLLAHLAEGRDVRLTVTRVHVGGTFVVVETTLAYTVVVDHKEQRIDRAGVAVFEFDGSLISRVAEY